MNTPDLVPCSRTARTPRALRTVLAAAAVLAAAPTASHAGTALIPNGHFDAGALG